MIQMGPPQIVYDQCSCFRCWDKGADRIKSYLHGFLINQLRLFSEIFISRTSHITQLFPVIINASYWLCFDTPFKNRPMKCLVIHINRTIVCTPYPPTFDRLGARDYIGTMPERCMFVFKLSMCRASSLLSGNTLQGTEGAECQLLPFIDLYST